MALTDDELLSLADEVANAPDSGVGDLYDRLVVMLNESPDDRRARFLFAAVCNRAKHYGVAKAIMEQLISQYPQWGALRVNYGMSLDYLGDRKGALSHYDIAVRDAKVDKVNLYNNRASALIKLGRFEDGDRAADMALKLQPDYQGALINKGFARLAMGDLPAGWDHYAKAANTKHRISIDYGVPQWTPEVRNARLIVHGEQGLGDEIMYASCLDEIRSLCDAVALDCNQHLAALFKRSFPEVEVHGTRNAKQRPWVDDFKPTHAVSLGTLPVFFRRDQSKFDSKPYLIPDEPMVAMYKALVKHDRPSAQVIGIAWSGGGPDTKEKEREIPLAAFKPLIEKYPNAVFVSLQYRDTSTLEIRKSGLPIKHFHFATGKGANYDHTAAMISACDWVIGTDTTVIHAAGALGVKTDCLLTSPAMWVWGPWMKDRAAWYKSVKLHRMPTEFDWSRYINHLTSQGIL